MHCHVKTRVAGREKQKGEWVRRWTEVGLVYRVTRQPFLPRQPENQEAQPLVPALLGLTGNAEVFGRRGRGLKCSSGAVLSVCVCLPLCREFIMEVCVCPGFTFHRSPRALWPGVGLVFPGERNAELLMPQAHKELVGCAFGGAGLLFRTEAARGLQVAWRWGTAFFSLLLCNLTFRSVFKHSQLMIPKYFLSSIGPYIQS